MKQPQSLQVIVTQTPQPDGTVRTEISGNGSQAIKAYILGAGLMVLNENLVKEEIVRLTNEDGTPKVQIWTPDGSPGPN
jgi:hypothetical protein